MDICFAACPASFLSYLVVRATPLPSRLTPYSTWSDSSPGETTNNLGTDRPWPIHCTGDEAHGPKVTEKGLPLDASAL